MTTKMVVRYLKNECLHSKEECPRKLRVAIIKDLVSGGWRSPEDWQKAQDSLRECLLRGFPHKLEKDMQSLLVHIFGEAVK